MPLPALISHCDQEKKLYNNVMHTDILPWNSFLQYLHGDTMIYMGKIRTRNICLLFFVLLFCSPVLLLNSPFNYLFFPPFRKSNFDSCGSRRSRHRRGPSARPLPGMGGIPSPPVRCRCQAWTCSRLR